MMMMMTTMMMMKMMMMNYDDVVLSHHDTIDGAVMKMNVHEPTYTQTYRENDDVIAILIRYVCDTTSTYRRRMFDA